MLLFKSRLTSLLGRNEVILLMQQRVIVIFTTKITVEQVLSISGVVKPCQGVAHATPVIHHATPGPPQEIMAMHTSMYHGQESHKMQLN